MKLRTAGAAALAGFLTVTGTLHFVSPGFIDAMIPKAVPGPARLWTYLSGVAELGIAATVAVPRTRRVGGYAAAALFVAVFPGNIKMAIDWSDRSLGARLGAYGRLPLQIPLLMWAVWVARQPAEQSETPTRQPATQLGD